MCEVLEELQGPLRLAAKYEFTKLHSLIGRTLEFMWPTTLDHWDARCDWEERNCDSDAWEPEHTPWAGTVSSYIQSGWCRVELTT